MNEEKSASVDTAIKGCDAVIDETMKNLANAYYFRGIAKFGKSDFDGAIGDYGQALQLDPADADYLNSRAAAYEAKNDVDRALADYNEAIKTSPNSIYAYNNRGAVFQRKGDFARAAADYGEVTKLQPNNIDAWSARCWVRAISPGQTQQALSDCNAALKIKPDAAGRARHPRLRLSQAQPVRQRHQGLRRGAEARSEAGRLALRTRPCQDPQGRPQRRHRRHGGRQGDQVRTSPRSSRATACVRSGAVQPSRPQPEERPQGASRG